MALSLLYLMTRRLLGMLVGYAKSDVASELPVR
jgi:hypothetical protein